MTDDIGHYIVRAKDTTDAAAVAKAKLTENLLNVVHEKLVETILADPKFQVLMREEDERIIALIEGTPHG